MARMWGFNHWSDERLVLVAIGSILLAVVLSTHQKLADKLTAKGVELSWLHHIGLFALVALVGVLGFVLFGLAVAAVIWAIKRSNRR